MSENLTEMDGSRSIDPERYDENALSTCQVCGSDTQGTGDGTTVGAYCPDCEKYVWIA